MQREEVPESYRLIELIVHKYFRDRDFLLIKAVPRQFRWYPVASQAIA